MSSDSEALVGNGTQLTGGDGETNTGEDVRVVALPRFEGLALAINIKRHLREWRTASEHTGTL